jgi:hypothetical protein
MSHSDDCPLCHGAWARKVPIPGRQNIEYEVECPTCGRFQISNRLISFELGESDIASRRHLLSAVSKSHPGLTIVDLDLIGRVREGQISEKTIEEKLALVLQTYARRSTEIGASCEMNPEADHPLAWCRSKDEWKAIVDALCSSEFGYLRYQETDAKKVQVTVKGWKVLEARPKAKGDVGFIAMAFDKKLDPVNRAIEQGIRSAGYEPLRINEDEYNGGIMDQILARIRESRFVVADFKLNKGGVCYEAGFAEGLGTEVFYLCEDSQVGKNTSSEDKVHFDISHLNLITWNLAELPLLAQKLENRIVRVLGKGPRSH